MYVKITGTLHVQYLYELLTEYITLDTIKKPNQEPKSKHELYSW